MNHDHPVIPFQIPPILLLHMKATLPLIPTARPDVDLPLVISRFLGEWRYLSNFSPCPWIRILHVDGDPDTIYPSVEHAYQAAKTLHSGEREAIRQAASGRVAKALGAQVTIRPDWDTQKIAIMRMLLAQKFSAAQVPDYRAGLIRTGDAYLIEGNTWGDEFWGATITTPDAGVTEYRGLNHLGKLLMDLRAEITRVT